MQKSSHTVHRLAGSAWLRRLRAAGVLVVTALLGACLLQRSGLGGGGGASADGGPEDAAGLDGGDAGRDGDRDDSSADADPCEGGACMPGSCADLLDASAELADGSYGIYVGGEWVTVYCDMTSEGGGWTRFADFDATRDSCPEGWVELSDPRACEMGDRPCSGLSLSVLFPTIVESYCEVRGYVRGYQGHSTDGFGSEDETIDGFYVDGVSITHGASPRHHVWTLASGLTRTRGFQSCPCNDGDPPPPFVGDSYYCDSGNPGSDWPNIWHVDNPLWGEDASDVECASPGSPGWFTAALPAPASDPIEVRLMVNQCDDNIAVDRMELYTR